MFDFAFAVFAEVLLFTTADTVCGGYDKNLPPRLHLWMAEPLWTIAEHLYDYRATRQNKRTKNASPQAGGHPIGVVGHHCSPDCDGLDTLCNRLVDCPAAQ